VFGCAEGVDGESVVEGFFLLFCLGTCDFFAFGVLNYFYFELVVGCSSFVQEELWQGAEKKEDGQRKS